MVSDLLYEIQKEIGLVEMLLHQKKDDEALKQLSNIIEKLGGNNNNKFQNEQLLDAFIVACKRRIFVYHKKEKYEEILLDIKTLQNVKYDIYQDDDVLLKTLESESEINKNNMLIELEKFKINSKLIDAAKENIDAHFNIDKMFSRENEKKASKKRKTMGR
ncbi:unnamed protein product [Rotaria sordida]|uniref:Uncharacterized protein n=1 Tax=Rotaria sordida TaxID=392033 RepID=A0A814T649_9BILA|nr:unnamed protein product [Rotaria sordida]CAF1399215.1 unnamed protein product [Rotaria sordida]